MLNLDIWQAFSFYKTFLHWYCGWYEPRYLEVGCLGGDLCASLKTKQSLGIDVNSHSDWPVYEQRHAGRVKFYHGSSDSFFEQNVEDWDLIFIDGDHSYEQVQKDFLNSITCLAEGGLIVMHDTLPPTVGDTASDKCGTAYKLRQTLRSTDYQMYTFPVTFGVTLVAPHGRDWPW